MDEWISPNRIWRIHRPDGWMIENLKSGFGDSPIVYEDGKVAFDHPESVPEYVKNKFRWIVKGRVDAVKEPFSSISPEHTLLTGEEIKRVRRRMHSD